MGRIRPAPIGKGRSRHESGIFSDSAEAPLAPGAMARIRRGYVLRVAQPLLNGKVEG